MNIDFSIIIPTYNREKELKECIDSILRQTLLPEEMIVIDDGDLSDLFLKKIKEDANKKGVEFIYYKKDHSKERRGLSESKNIALDLVKNEIFFILDDDLVLDNDFLEKIMDAWKTNDNFNLIGVGGIIKNNRKKNRIEKVYNTIFGLTSNYKWDVNDVGFQVWDDGIKEREIGYYTHGGVCSYRTSLVKELGRFAVFEGGRTALEDVDFCLRAKNKGYYFIVEPKAKVFHKRSVIKEKEFQMGFKESYNRKIIFKNNCHKSFKNRFWFFWANLGWILRQFLVGNFSRGLGMIKGYLL